MSQTTSDSSTRQPALRDRSFWGLTVGQFLGAFNDNLFKQLVLLLCVDVAVRSKTEPNQVQSYAQATFALPWVLFSGLAGFLADRTSKRTGIVWYKASEIAIALAGVVALRSGGIIPVFVVLFLLSLHSTFFGPCKYGFLPELFPKRDLPLINGIFQMTTFVAIILGQASAGFGKERLEASGELWLLSLACVGIATVGCVCVTVIRPTSIARPGLPFRWSNLGFSVDVYRVLKADRFLLTVLLLTSVFWFLGGVVNLLVNVFGKVELQLSDGRTSLLLSCLSIGIAIGCILAGSLSRQRIRFGIVRAGALGIALGCVSVLLINYYARTVTLPGRVTESFGDLLWTRSMPEFLARLTMIELGAAAGLFIVPLQVVLQSRPPDDIKGRMIGSMNLINWIGILLSAVFVKFAGRLISVINENWATDSPLPSVAMLGLLALLTLPIAMFFRPGDRDLS